MLLRITGKAQNTRPPSESLPTEGTGPEHTGLRWLVSLIGGLKPVLSAYAAIFALVNVITVPIAPALAADQPPGTVKILALGDSLMAGYNLPNGQAVPDHLARMLADSPVVRDNRLSIEMINGGVSGDTSAGGLARLDWMLADTPDLVLLELGANDALRGLSPADTRSNLTAILTRLQQDGATIVLAGMLAPPNMYTESERAAFNRLYPELAQQFGAHLYPFFLDGVAAVPTLLQKDGMHPTAEGTALIAHKLVPIMESAITDVLNHRKAPGLNHQKAPGTP